MNTFASGGPGWKDKTALGRAFCRLFNLGNGLEVAVNVRIRLPERRLCVRNGVSGEKRFHILFPNPVLTELRHGGEEVVLDLEIEISHPPVGQPMVVDVDRMARRGDYPPLVRFICSGCGMGYGKRSEEKASSDKGYKVKEE